MTMNMMPVVTGVYEPIKSADDQFTTVFGSNYMDKIPDEVKNTFLPTSFDFWKMYNGFEDFECNITRNLGPYVKTAKNDSFYIDWYAPKSTVKSVLPTIINIHGGAWVLGNKGTENMPLVSKYLASRGYNVFDIQYGLYHFPDDAPWINDFIANSQAGLGRDLTNGTYTVQEQIIMVLGNLTDYLVANAATLKINTSCVYVMGRSAGGHLTASFLGYNSTYIDVFNHSLKLRGLIPFYCPANLTDLYITHADDAAGKLIGLEPLMAKAFGGNPIDNASLYNEISPVDMVDQSAPPVLLLHGTHDLMVPIREARQLKSNLDALNNHTIMIEFPFYGHAFDVSFNGPAGQISLYYIERFLAITQYMDV